jgi:hypothetical protein
MGGRGFHGFRGELGELAIKTLIQSTSLTPLEDRSDVIQPYGAGGADGRRPHALGHDDRAEGHLLRGDDLHERRGRDGEAAAKPESALDFTLREDNVRKIATWVPVTDEMMEDVPTFESYLRGRLGFMVRAARGAPAPAGQRRGQNILGLYNRTGVQTVTGYGQSTIDSILQGITEVETDAFATRPPWSSTPATGSTSARRRTRPGTTCSARPRRTRPSPARGASRCASPRTPC